MKKANKPPPNHNDPTDSEEAKYYAAKNNALFNAQAQAAKAKANNQHMYKQIPKDHFLVKQREKNIQPEPDGNVEYQQGPVYYPQKQVK